MMGMVQKTMMLEQELALLKKQKQDEVAEKGEKAEAKEVDAALGVMFNGTQTKVHSPEETGGALSQTEKSN